MTSHPGQLRQAIHSLVGAVEYQPKGDDTLRPGVKAGVHCHVKHNFENAFALPIFDDKAMPNF